MNALKKKLAPSDSRLSHLTAVSLFSELRDNTEALAELAQIMSAKDFAPGEEILREGEMGTELFILIEGYASVFKKTSAGELYKVAVFEGSHHVFFGEGAMLEADARSATIRADSSCHCLVLDRDKFLAFCRKYPAWALPVLNRIARSVMARLKKMNTDLALLYNALVSEIRGHET